MAIPANIAAEIASLQAQVVAAAPIASAGHATVVAIKLNAGQIVSDLQAVLIASNMLDGWTAPKDAPSIVAAINGIVQTAVDQGDVSLKRGLIGRVTSNLDQIPT